MAKDKPIVMVGRNLNKGLCFGKPGRFFKTGRDFLIVWLKGDFRTGDPFTLKDIDKIDTHIHFCDKDSLKLTIDALQKMHDEWSDEDESISQQD